MNFESTRRQPPWWLRPSDLVSDRDVLFWSLSSSVSSAWSLKHVCSCVWSCREIWPGWALLTEVSSVVAGWTRAAGSTRWECEAASIWRLPPTLTERFVSDIVMNSVPGPIFSSYPFFIWHFHCLGYEGFPLSFLLELSPSFFVFLWDRVSFSCLQTQYSDRRRQRGAASKSLLWQTVTDTL